MKKILKKSYKSNTFKILAPTWNNKFELPDGLYSISHIQDYFKYIIKKHQPVSDDPPIRIYVNKIEERIAFKIKTWYYVSIIFN